MRKDIRENNLDILRIIAAIMVIIQHVLAIYIFRTRDNLPGYTTTANLFISVSVFAVPIFVMLSGAFLLDDNKNKDYQKFYKKNTKKNNDSNDNMEFIIFFVYNVKDINSF